MHVPKNTVRFLFALVLYLIFLRLLPKDSKLLDNVFLRAQLASAQQKFSNHKIPKPQSTPVLRLVLGAISQRSDTWKSCAVLFKPDTIIRWHRSIFKLLWTFKSRKRGRPQISPETIRLIQNIFKKNPLFSPEKIHELLVNMNVSDAPAPNTIAKYLAKIRPRRSPSQKQIQSWLTFLGNHNLWSMDFCTVPTIRFQVLYVFVLISHARRRIEHVAVTTNPTSEWLIQQLRHATPFGKQPKYLLHDNAPVAIKK